MRTLLTLLIVALLAGCGGMGLMPEKSQTKLEKSPCACDEGPGRHA